MLRAAARDARKHCISCMCIMLMINVRKLRAESRVGVRRQIRNLWSTRLKRHKGFLCVKHWVATPPPGRRGRRFTKGSWIGGGGGGTPPTLGPRSGKK